MSEAEQVQSEKEIRNRGKQIELALQDEFQDIFVKNLNFGEVS
jgi:hypothetical protein